VKKFDFKLQKLLEIRQKKEDQEKIELSRASGAYQFVLNKKEKILSNVQVTLDNLKKNKTGLTLRELQDYDRLIKNSETSVRMLEEEIEAKRKIMQEHIDKYAALKRDRRVVETLKDKALAKYESDAQMEEQKETDEIGQDLFLRNKEN
jgi:flagellar FliJ protein